MQSIITDIAAYSYKNIYLIYMIHIKIYLTTKYCYVFIMVKASIFKFINELVNCFNIDII